MKTLEFIYQETEIHFLINPQSDSVMINATEMANIFGKRVDVFLKSEHAKAFIKVYLSTPNGGDNSERKMEELVKGSKRGGTYMARPLALKFAAWLDPEFEYWVFNTIDDILFGHYKKHWSAHAAQEAAKMEMEKIKNEILLNPTPEKVSEYFHQERIYKESASEKRKAIKNQISMFDLNNINN